MDSLMVVLDARIDIIWNVHIREICGVNGRINESPLDGLVI